MKPWSSWVRPKSWPRQQPSTPLPLRRASANLMFGGKATSYGRCPLMTSLSFATSNPLLKVLKVFGGNRQKYNISTNFVGWLGAFLRILFEFWVWWKCLPPPWKQINSYLHDAFFQCAPWFNWEFDLTQVTFWVMERPVRTERGAGRGGTDLFWLPEKREFFAEELRVCANIFYLFVC